MIFNNPQILLKARPHFKEFFLVDLGIVRITNSYKVVTGKNRKNPEEKRWLKVYHFAMNNLHIERHDHFQICNPTDLNFDLFLHHMTWEEYKLPDTEIDKCMDMQLSFGKVELNLRQIDYTDLLRFNDLNLMYTDNKWKYYQYSAINAKDSIISDKPQYTYSDDTLLAMHVSVFFPEFDIKLFRDFDNIITELSLREQRITYKKTLTNKNEISVKINQTKAYQILNNNRCSEFITENTSKADETIDYSSEPLKKEMILVNYLIDFDKEKTVLVNVNNIKVFVRLDLMNIIKMFFTQGFPNYKNVETRDQPNLCKIILKISRLKHR